jgi:Bacterial archaeo-eukaryotic release factor family 3
MTSLSVQENTLIKLDDLKELAAQSGPCVSIYLPSDGAGNSRQLRAQRMKTALKEVIPQLPETEETEKLLSPLRRIAAGSSEELAPGGSQSTGVMVFRAPNYMKIVACDAPFRSCAIIGDEFYIRPALPALTEPVQFYLLALSRKHVQLFRCSGERFESLPLPASMPESVAAAGGFDQPDHDLANRATAGPGAAGRIQFGTSADRENAWLHNFFKAVDRALRPSLMKEGLPLVVSAVREELAAYAEVNTYPGMIANGIQRSPERAPGAELHQLGIEAVKAHFSDAKRKLVGEIRESAPDRVSVGVERCLKAARDGHVGYLLLPESETSNEQDLNRIAMDTVRNSGKISLVPLAEIPRGGPVAALLRYPAGETRTAKL